MRFTIALICGLIFGLGLIASGMTDPGKVKGFLDVAGAWDPSLAFVMGAAILVALLPFARAKRAERSWTGDLIELPKATMIDARLLGGGAMFGVGWGLAGFCPGPALVSLASGVDAAAIFVVAMLAGMAAHDFMRRRVA